MENSFNQHSFPSQSLNGDASITNTNGSFFPLSSNTLSANPHDRSMPLGVDDGFLSQTNLLHFNPNAREISHHRNVSFDVDGSVVDLTNGIDFNQNARYSTSHRVQTMISQLALHSAAAESRALTLLAHRVAFPGVPGYNVVPSQATIVNINLQNNHQPIILNVNIGNRTGIAILDCPPGFSPSHINNHLTRISQPQSLSSAAIATARSNGVGIAHPTHQQLLATFREANKIGTMPDQGCSSHARQSNQPQKIISPQSGMHSLMKQSIAHPSHNQTFVVVNKDSNSGITRDEGSSSPARQSTHLQKVTIPQSMHSLIKQSYQHSSNGDPSSHCFREINVQNPNAVSMAHSTHHQSFAKLREDDNIGAIVDQSSSAHARQNTNLQKITFPQVGVHTLTKHKYSLNGESLSHCFRQSNDQNPLAVMPLTMIARQESTDVDDPFENFQGSQVNRVMSSGSTSNHTNGVPTPKLHTNLNNNRNNQVQQHPDHAIRNKSHPYVKYGPYTCPRCENKFETSQSFAAHTTTHYMEEELKEKKRRRELKCKKRDLCIVQSDEGVTVAPRSLVNETHTSDDE